MADSELPASLRENNARRLIQKRNQAKDIMTTLPPISNGTRWYYADANSQPQGPYSCEELSRLLTDQIISKTTLVIKEGDSEWKPYHEIFCGLPSQPTLPPVPLPSPTAPQPKDESTVSQTPVLQAVGDDGSIELFHDKIRVKRKGVVASMTGMKGERTVFLSQITAVQFKAAGFLQGSIQISYPGASVAYENTIRFQKARQPAFEKIKTAIENYRAAGSIGITQSETAAMQPTSLSRASKKKAQGVPDPIVLWLLFCFPFGLYLLWKEKTVPIHTKAIVSAIFGGVALIAMSIFVVLMSPASYSTSVAHSAPADSPQQSISSTQAVPEQIRGMMETIYGEQLKGIEATRQIDDGYLVLVDCNDSFRSVVNMRAKKSNIHQKMMAAYKRLYTSGIKVNRVLISICTDVTDKYGNKSNKAVYQTALSKEEAEKIQWNNLGQVDLGKVWEVTLIIPDLYTDGDIPVSE